jgi:hypothetical protein
MFASLFGLSNYDKTVQALLERQFGSETGRQVARHPGTRAVVAAYEKDGTPPEKAAKYIILKITRGPKSDSDQRTIVALTSEFAKYNVNFMTMDPIIYYAVFAEAALFGRVPKTVKMFFELADEIGRRAATEEEKIALLSSIYEKRGELLTLEPKSEFDIENLEIAGVFHRLHDAHLRPGDMDVATKLKHPFFKKGIEDDYNEANLAKDGFQVDFNSLVSKMIGVLETCERKLIDRPNQQETGLSVGLTVILRVVFGSGPGLTEAYHFGERYRTTLALLAKISTGYADTREVNDFVNGVMGAFSEFHRRCEQHPLLDL